MEETLYDILEKIRVHHSLFIGSKSLEKLAIFIGGFECASQVLTNNPISFNSKFQIYIEYMVKNDSSKHWSVLIEESAQYRDAFELFYEYLDNFKEHVKTQGDFEDLLKKHKEFLMT